MLALNGPDNRPNKGIDMEMFWVVYNIPGTATSVPQGLKPGDQADGSHQATGRNIAGYRAVIEAANVFERFWRGDRSRHQTGSRFGLGLTLANFAARALGGTVTASSELGGEFRVVVILPIG